MRNSSSNNKAPAAKKATIKNNVLRDCTLNNCTLYDDVLSNMELNNCTINACVVKNSVLNNCTFLKSVLMDCTLNYACSKEKASNGIKEKKNVVTVDKDTVASEGTKDSVEDKSTVKTTTVTIETNEVDSTFTTPLSTTPTTSTKPTRLLISEEPTLTSDTTVEPAHKSNLNSIQTATEVIPVTGLTFSTEPSVSATSSFQTKPFDFGSANATHEPFTTTTWAPNTVPRNPSTPNAPAVFKFGNDSPNKPSKLPVTKNQGFVFVENSSLYGNKSKQENNLDTMKAEPSNKEVSANSGSFGNVSQTSQQNRNLFGDVVQPKTTSSSTKEVPTNDGSNFPTSSTNYGSSDIYSAFNPEFIKFLAGLTQS